RAAASPSSSPKIPALTPSGAPWADAPVPILYTFASYLLFWLALPVLVTHPKLREGFLERLGVYRRKLPVRSAPRIWLHGASAGDLLALEPILERLRAGLPDATLIVSTLTNSGKL